MLPDNHRQFHHIFFLVLHLSGIYTSINGSVTHFLNFISIRNINKCKKTSIHSFITHFLTLISIRKKLYCRVISIDSFITDFLSHIAISDEFECISVIINSYHLFFDFCSSQEQVLKFHHFLE